MKRRRFQLSAAALVIALLILASFWLGVSYRSFAPVTKSEPEAAAVAPKPPDQASSPTSVKPESTIWPDARVLSEQQERLATQDKQIAQLRAENRRLTRAIGAAQRVPPSPPPVAQLQPPPPPPPPVVAEMPVPVPPTASLPPPDMTFEEYKCAQNNQPCRVEVFYATDRAKITDITKRDARVRAHKVAFGGDRSKNTITYGWCDVTMPRNHQKMTGRLDEAGTYDVTTSVFIHDVIEANRDDFLDRLRTRVNQDPAKEILVFIHGYNVTFFEAARRTAQMHYDLGFKGAPAFFSWPSGGNLQSYLADEASSEWAAGHLREFLDLLAARSGATKIHLIAHSMGNRPLSRALADIGRRETEIGACPLPGPVAARAKFSQVVMAAPDLDQDVFLQLKDAMQRAAERVTIYASAKDRAVLGSKFLHRFARLGNPKGEPAFGPKIEAIDATAASTDFLGHSYYGSSILWDVQFVLGMPQQKAVERCTIHKAQPPSQYPTFVPQIDPTEKPGAVTRAWLRMTGQRKSEPIEHACKVNLPVLTAAAE